MLLYSGLEVTEFLDVGTEDLALSVTVLLTLVPCDLREAEAADVPSYDLVVAEYDLEPSDR